MEKERTAALVHRAQNGDLQAMEQLLEAAHTSVSYQCRKMMPHPEEAQDLTQEILLAVYQNIGKLEESKAFWSWLNRITATHCMNALTRTHVDLQFAEDEDGHSTLDDLEETDEQSIPDKAIDNAETARMIDEIVSNLPEAQRLSTLMYYYDEMSIKEIAQIMGVPENTVKSRLNLARKSIKEKVLDYERQGVKLYSVSVLPFLWYFLRTAAKSEANTGTAAVCAANVVAEGIAVGGTAIAEGAVAHFAIGKVVTLIATCIVAIGGISFGVVKAVNQYCRPVPTFICWHEWSDANCTKPKTCRKCDSTEGEAIGHYWEDTDCETSKTCRICGETEGESLGHSWTDATCETAKICRTCATTEGEALGHTTVIDKAIAATCENPGLTEGNHCSCCGVVITEQVAVSAKGHSWSVWVVTNTPEIGIAGAEQRTCSSCNKVETREIDTLPEPDYEVFEHEVGVYHVENKEYEMAIKNHFDYAAFISVYTTDKKAAHETAIIDAFEENFGFTPTAKVVVEKIGDYLMNGQAQTVYQYSIFDTTYPFLDHDPYKVYHQICTDGISHWVGFAIYGSFADDWNGLFSTPEVQKLEQEMFELFYEVTGYDAEYITEHKDDFCIHYISVAGEMRTADGEIVEILYIYCREKERTTSVSR